LGMGDWGLGIGDWAQSPIPNPQSPIPNPQSPIYLFFTKYFYLFEKSYFLNSKMENGTNKNEFTDSEEYPSDTDTKESKLKQQIVQPPKKIENKHFQKKSRPLDENEKIQDYGKPIINKYTFKRSDFSYKTRIYKSYLPQQSNKFKFNQFSQIIKKKTFDDKNLSEPKDNLSKRSSRNYSSINQNIFFTRQKYLKDSYNLHNESEDIPRTMFFQKYDNNSRKKETKSSINVNVIQDNNSELIEIPREKYSEYRGKEPVYMSGGIDTGEYKFNGAKIVLKEKEIPIGKITIKEEEINKEIISRKNKAKKDPKKKYEVLDKFYATTDFPGKHIVEVKKVKTQKRNQEQYFYQKNNKSYENINKYEFKKYKNKNKKDGQNLNLNQIENHNKYFNIFRTYKNDENYFEENLYKNNNLSNEYNITLPIDNYSKYMLDEINKIRADPQSFIGIIEDAKDNIKNKNGKIFYNGKVKIALSKGESAFNDAINYLRNTKPMEKLKYSKLMTVKPPVNERNINDKRYIGNKVKIMLKNGIKIKSYWRDIINDPEISFLLMIVDDNGLKSGMRRNDILDPDMKYIGISSVQVNHSFSCYITLGSEL